MEWKGRRVSFSGDYPRVYWPDHPMAAKGGMVKIHRAVMAEAVGRLLIPDEVVHHKDEDRNNWSLDNLCIETLSSHGKLHAPDPIWVVCNRCGSSMKIHAFRRNNYQFHYCSQTCQGLHQEKIVWPSDAQLEKLVWQKPMTVLSCDLGVSDKAVKKRCTKRGIPFPPRGYWLRK